MSFELKEFAILAGVIFLIYLFWESKIYLALWAAILHLIILTLSNFRFYKIILVTYVILILCSYLYVFRNVLIGKEKPPEDSKLALLQKNEIKKKRMGKAALILFVAYVAAFIFFRN